ncbi:MAG: DNA-directed RNA polymerase subunit D [Candidatus Aenigmarchaeota archaeon]|nr:DNA-directed RNA polymerase subunit D [Candidatus Aenigmarchaeota archaeon]
MKVRIISKKQGRLDFVLEDATPAFANALRRAMISEVPTLAIQYVDFHDNGSVMFDEVLAHRLGLIPLSFGIGKMNMPDECKCEGKGCTLCQVVFAAEKTGPGMLLSGDMKSSHKGVAPLDPNFPIVELLGGQSVRFEAVASLGTARKHAKHQAAIVGYQYFVEAEKAKDEELAGLEDCPSGLAEVRGGKVVILDYFKADMKKACRLDSYILQFDENRFIFRVETVSGLAPEDIVLQAAQILGSKAADFARALKDV